MFIVSYHFLRPLTPGGGGTQIWKWRTSAYRRTKIGGIRCKISSKKGGQSVWAPKKKKKKKNGGFFGVDSQKWGSFSVQKMPFQGKICTFSVEIATKSLNFQKFAINFYVKFDTKVEKRGSLGVDWMKNGVIGCRVGIKRGVYWQALDIHQHMGVPPPPGPLTATRPDDAGQAQWNVTIWWPIHIRPRFFGTAIQCEIARCFPRSVA